MKRKNIIVKALTCGLASLAITACTDSWDSHYQPKPELNASATLWELIQDDPELDQFEAYVKATGYEDALKQNRFYTIWAPVDDSEFYTTHPLEEGISDSMLNVYKFEFIENHIADYNHTATGTMANNLVKMLNGKYNKFDGAGDAYTFKGAPVKKANIAAKNGLLHKTEGHATFTANIWEQLAKVESISLLNEFLKSYDEIVFDESNSVQGPMVGGQVTYLDSVIIEYNPWFDRFGIINREDSSYTMFAPTNKAWNEMLEVAKTYFVYDEQTIHRDSLQEVMAKDFMCRHLVFSNTIQRSPEDSLVSICYTNMTGYGRVQRKVFKGDELTNLYSNKIESQELSNGTLHIVDSYNYPTTVWHDTLRVEGESLYSTEDGATVAEYAKCTKEYASISKDSVAKYKQTSNGQIGIYAPTTKSGNPELTYTVKNVLSAKYRIKVVFVPSNFTNFRDTTLLPNKFKAELYYRDAAGKKQQKISLGEDIITDPTKVDTITLVTKAAAEAGVDYFEFPVNEFNLDANSETFTQLVIKSNVKNSDKTEDKQEIFDRIIRIDQVFFEPVIE